MVGLGERPWRLVIWGGGDFGVFLGALGELGYGFAYRVLYAQHFGVPQRRKRVFVVGCLGDWRSAAKVLFESESLQRDITPSREKRKETTDTLIPSVANCLQTTCNDYSRADGFNMITESVGAIDLKPISKTLTASYGMGGADLDIKPLVLEPQAYNITFCDANGTRKDRPNGGLYVNETDTSNTLTSAGVGTNIMETYTFPADMNFLPSFNPKVSNTLIRKGNMSVTTNMRVRRLTPIECERLQGFPDSYTNTPTASDSTRYKALGNSMAVPVMKWIGQRINEL